MKCIVAATNVKILAKAIHALAKVGDEMYIEPQKSTLSFRVVNMASSAYAEFTFYQNYFSYYIYGDLQENDALKCKISMRSAIGVFKASNVIDKQVQTCHIILEPDATEILFILKYKNGTVKTHLLPILDCETLQFVFDKDYASVKLLSQPRVLSEALRNFHQHLVEITLEVLAEKLLLRNYIDDTLGISNITRTQLVLDKREFDRYDISNETSITFCMKEFKSMLNFAENVGVSVSIYVDGPGQPAIFALTYPSFKANLVLSTLSADIDSQSDTTLNCKREQTIKQTSGIKRAAHTRRQKFQGGIRNILNKYSRVEKSITVKDTRLRNAEEEKQKHQLICEEQDNSLINAFSTSTKESQVVNEVYHMPTTQDVVKGTHLRSAQEEKQKHQQICKEQNNSSINAFSTSTTKKRVVNEVRCIPETQATQEEPQKCSTSGIEISNDFNRASTSKEELVYSKFSTITKRTPVNTAVVKRKRSEECSILKDSEQSPPQPLSKIARIVFKKLFEPPFDPATLPGWNEILVEDSDECCSE